jgi:hypothetical protein
MKSVDWLRVGLVLAMLLLTEVRECAARIWTDRQGRAVEAEFVRVSGAQAVLQLPTGRVVQTPLVDLSEADQAYIGEQLRAAGVRVWTDLQGRQVHGQYVRVRDGKVYLKVQEKTTPVLFPTLSIADRWFVRQAAGERDAKELPEATPEETLPDARTWTDVEGVEAQGQLDRVLPDGRVLLAVEGQTRIVDIKQLSAVDHDYLRKELEDTPLARLVPPPKPKPVEVAAINPPRMRPPVPPVVPPIAQRTRPTPATSSPRQPRTESPIYIPPAPTVKLVLRCPRCGRVAPAGARYGDPCPDCNKRSTSPYEMGRRAGVITRYVLIGIAALSAIAWAAKRFM